MLAGFDPRGITCVQETWWDVVCEGRVTGWWGGTVAACNGGSRSGGVAVFFGERGNYEWRVLHEGWEGRVIVCDVASPVWSGRLINVHAPHDQVSRKLFLTALEPWFTPTTLIIGDFNIVQSCIDAAPGNVLRNDVSRYKLLDIYLLYNFVDMWRVLNPGVRGYSRVQRVMGVLKKSRLDLLLVAGDLIGKIGEVKYVPCAWSDHFFLRCSMRGERGGGGGVMVPKFQPSGG